jgi:hypothetical protein
MGEPPQIIVMPFRYEVYSTNIEELFDELGRIFQEIVGEQEGEGESSVVSVGELPAPNLQDYVISIQTILSEFRKIVERLRPTGRVLLSELVRGLEPIDAARVFILLLFAANSGEVVINQEDDDEDALVVSVGQLE